MHLCATESPSTSRLPLLLGQFGFGAVENFEKLSDTVAHAAVHISFRALDVVVEVVAEELDARDGVFHDLGVGKVSRE